MTVKDLAAITLRTPTHKDAIHLIRKYQQSEKLNTATNAAEKLIDLGYQTYMKQNKK